MSFTVQSVANPLLPTWGEAVPLVISLLLLGLIIVAVIAVLRSEHTVAAKAGMLLLCFLVPLLGAFIALLLARQEPDPYPASSRAPE